MIGKYPGPEKLDSFQLYWGYTTKRAPFREKSQKGPKQWANCNQHCGSHAVDLASASGGGGH